MRIILTLALVLLYSCGQDATNSASQEGGSGGGGGSSSPSPSPSTYTLTLVNTNGTVTKSPNQTTFNSGTSVTLTAHPNSGYHFVSWSGDVSSALSSITITMDSNKNITANFASPAFVAKGDRILAMDFLDPPNGQTFDYSLAKAKAAGVEVATLHMNWNYYDTTSANCTDPDLYASTYANSYSNGWILDTFNTYYSASGTTMKLNLTLRPIDQNYESFPTDLAGRAFTDAQVICRFKAFIKWTFSKIPSLTLTNLMIGNEVDGHSQSNNGTWWSQYATFFVGVRDYARTLKPNLKVGITSMWSGLVSNTGTQAAFKSIASQGKLDVVGFTYYPINGDFSVKDPSVVDSEIGQVVTEFSTSLIYIQEAGYQSSSGSNSSNYKQAQFVRNVFYAWDKYRNNIKLVNFLRLHDMSHTAAVNTAAAPPYNSSDPKFIGYLETLGLRSYADQDKDAFSVLDAEAGHRGW